MESRGSNYLPWEQHRREKHDPAPSLPYMELTDKSYWDKLFEISFERRS
jgi:hypothetical protein